MSTPFLKIFKKIFPGKKIGEIPKYLAIKKEKESDEPHHSYYISHQDGKIKQKVPYIDIPF